ncbi:M28 family metallopeptidase [Dokdonella sp.]|uniref:M28 family metallopeptidase n=1 Tax=Dokdonella sp. TaxID=2291710 RepID=UPI003528E7A3
MKRTLASALALTLPLIAAAADSPEFDAKRLSEEVKMLSSDAFEGRGPATAAEKKTIDYVVEQMKGAGLQPGGDLKDGKRLWTQAVPLLRAEIKGTPKLGFSHAGKPMALTQGEQIAVRAAMDGSTSVAIKDAPLIFVGYGTRAPERNWNDFAGTDLKGKIAIALVNDPDFESGEGDFGGKAMTYYGRWTYKYEEAARQGAAGLLIVHETEPASYGWATVKNSNTNTMFDVVRDQPGSVHPQVEGWIQRDVAVDLFRQAGLDFEALKKKAQKRGFKAVPLTDTTFSAEYTVDSQVITSHNIVGRVEGSKRPDETVIYSAHWDHLGVGRPDAEGDTIYNGAVDNATGTAALIEMGRAFANGPKPERSIVFLNVTAEEKGLLGSEYYSSKPLYPLATTVAVINMDGLDPTIESRNFTTSGSAKSELLDALVAQGEAAGMSYVTDPHPEAGYFFRSDHFPFAKRGVPALSWGSGNDLVVGGTAAGEAADMDYREKRYHQPADEWEASWTFAGMVHDLPILYRLGNALANSTQWPSWSEDSEFRGIRDETAAQRK